MNATQSSHCYTHSPSADHDRVAATTLVGAGGDSARHRAVRRLAAAGGITSARARRAAPVRQDHRGPQGQPGGLTSQRGHSGFLFFFAVRRHLCTAASTSFRDHLSPMYLAHVSAMQHDHRPTACVLVAHLVPVCNSMRTTSQVFFWPRNSLLGPGVGRGPRYIPWISELGETGRVEGVRIVCWVIPGLGIRC